MLRDRSGSVSDPAERLAALSEPDLYEFLDGLATARWGGEWTVELSPPSPRGGVDVVLERDDERRLLHVRQHPPSSAVGAPDVREVAALRDPRNLDAVALATTSAFSEAAREAARERSVRLVGPGELLGWAEAAGVAPPPAEPDPPAADQIAERYAGYWPESLRDRVGGVMAALDDLAAFDYEVHHADASTELRCRIDERVPVRVRFAETSFLVSVGEAGDYETVVRLTARRDNQPPLSELVGELRAAVDRSLGR